MILGLPISTFIWVIALPLVSTILLLIAMLRNSYEGKKTEETFDVDDWYHTF